MRIHKTIIVIVLISLLFSLNSCNSKNEFAENLISRTDIISLNKYLEISNSTAEKWEKDAYIVRVDVTFSGENDNFIDIAYESQNQKNIAYSIWINDDGDVEKEPFFKYDINSINKIKETDWKLDSPDALRIAFSDKRTKEFFIDQTDYACGFMVLEKTNLPKHALMWRVNIDNCKDIINSIQIEIDAKTGKIFN